MVTVRSIPLDFRSAGHSTICTVTTVGYGDESPVTGQGRLIAVLLMIGGIGLVGTVTATLASWIVQRVAQEDNEYQAATAAQIEALREDARLQMGDLHDEIQQLKEVVTSQQPPPSHADGRPLHGSTVLGIGNGFVEASGRVLVAVVAVALMAWVAWTPRWLAKLDQR